MEILLESDMRILFDKLVVLLRSPYPELRARWKTVVLPSLLVFFILYVLQPFGIWTVGKEILSTLLLCVLITLGNWCYTAGVFGLELNLRLLAVCLLWMVVIGPFPIVLFVMWNRNLQLSHNLQEAVAMNARLAERVQAEAVSEPRSAAARGEVLLEGGTRESLALDPARLLYAESEGNYVRLRYLDAGSGKTAVKLLRLTLKQAEDAFLDYSYIIRCHRAYLVNLHRVAQVSGNAQGYRLHLEGCGMEVPVSRSYAVRVKRALEGNE